MSTEKLTKQGVRDLNALGRPRQVDVMGGAKEGATGPKLIAELLDELYPDWRKRTV
jgi:hypothetical protein